MCNMLPNSIAASLSPPFVAAHLAPPPSSPHVPISAASAPRSPIRPSVRPSVRPSAASCRHLPATLWLVRDSRRSQQPEPHLFGWVFPSLGAFGRCSERENRFDHSCDFQGLCGYGPILEINDIYFTPCLYTFIVFCLVF